MAVARARGARHCYALRVPPLTPRVRFCSRLSGRACRALIDRRLCEMNGPPSEAAAGSASDA
eukprot:349725-Chlamydomonas_euryale.AAC.2